MAKHWVICSVCNKKFDANEEPYLKTYNGRRYAHKECLKRQELNQEIIQRIHEKAKEVLGETYSRGKVEKNIQSMIKDGKTPINIFRTLEYWYDVKGHTAEKANGGIAIVDYVYGDAMNYYQKQKKFKTLNDTTNIEDYISDTKTLIFKPKPIQKPKKIKLFNLE